MKKNYVLILGLSLSVFSFGQKHESVKNAPLRMDKSISTTHVANKKSNNTVNEKAGGDLVYQNTFDTPSDWTIDNSSQTAADYGWAIQSSASGWFFTGFPIQSTSGGNFAQVNNGDASTGTQALNVIYTISSANPIAITTNNLTLSFEQYGARFYDAQEVYISVDNLNWTLVGDNSNLAQLTANGGTEYNNPDTKTIVLGSSIPVGSTSLYVRFQWTTAFPSSTSANAWIAYGWMIDDVMITETYGDDLSLNSVYWGAFNGLERIPYYQTPIDQVQPVEIGGVVDNFGFTDKTDAVFGATCASPSFAGASATSTILAYGRDTLYTSSPFPTPATVGTYTLSGLNVSTSVDAIPTNNAAADVAFDVTNYIYARDMGVKDGITNNAGLAYESCNQFDVYTGTAAYGVDFYVDATTVTGTTLTVNIRDINAQTIDILAYSDDHIITAAEKGKMLTVPFTAPYTTAASTSYLVCVATFGSGGVGKDLVVGTSGVSQDNTSFFLDEVATLYYTNETPMVRMNFDPKLGVNKITNEFSSFSVFPNPANDKVSVDFSLKNEASVKISVTDLSGKEIYASNLGSKAASNHSVSINTANFANGVYVVNFITNNGVATEKLVINK